MATLSYNGVILPYSETTHYAQNVMYDDLGKTDWYLTQYDISVQCLINVSYLSLIAPGLIAGGIPVTTNPAAIITYMRRQLMAPRCQLSFQFNGVELIPQHQLANGGSPIPGTVDSKNGPQPQHCSFSIMTNTLFLLDYRIIAHYWENNQTKLLSFPLQNQTGCPVLSNRWSETASIDSCGFTTKNRQGRYIIRSDNADGKVVDQYRSQFAVVGVPPGFLRKRAEYTVSPDGLGLSYTIMDEEQFKMPPNPAYEADGDYIESIANHSLKNRSLVPKRIGRFRLRLKGAANTDQASMITQALRIAAAKFQSVLKGNGATTTYGISCSVRVNSYKNEIDLEMVRGYNSNLYTIGGVPGFANESLCFTPGSDNVPKNSYTPLYYTRGSASLLLKAAAYYDPSIPAALAAINPATGQSNVGVEVGKAGVTLES